MSNRSLLEINHDTVAEITRDPARFVADLEAYLASGSPRSFLPLKDRYGINLFGMRHHSEGFKIRWGSFRAAFTPMTRQVGPQNLTTEGSRS